LQEHSLTDAIIRASEYLLDIQRQDGLWEDYDLPVGKSDEWISAFTGLAIIDAENLGLIRARPQLTCTAITLVQRQRTTGGWGYNRQCKPDTDSTSFVCKFLQEMGWTIDSKSAHFIESHWRPDEGCFATYQGPLAWGNGHWDVTPYAAMSVSDAARINVVPAFLNSLEKHRLRANGWQSYWWSNNLYSTMITLEVLTRLSQIHKILPFTEFQDHPPSTPFEIACLMQIGHYANWSKEKIAVLTNSLLSCQLGNGSWEGSPQLRVTAPQCDTPWIEPIGDLYIDTNSTVTTSLAIRSLASQARSCF